MCNNNSDSSNLFATISDRNPLFYFVQAIISLIPLLFKTRKIGWQAIASSRHKQSTNNGKGIENLPFYINTPF